jgi:hypothetical protein
MARTSPISVVGATVLISVMSHPACDPGGTPELNDPEGVTVDSDPPALQAVWGDGFVAVWTDRDLAWGERIERIDPDLTVTEIGNHGHVWLDANPGTTYRWVGPDAEEEVVPASLDLELIATGQPAAAQRGDAVTRGISWKGADLYGLPVALVVERDGEAWLDARCEDGQPCWREEPVWWARWDQGDIPSDLAVSWWAVLDEPGLSEIELRLEVVRDEVGGTIATADEAVVETGRRILWGDLHTHSNLSYDGCEDPENDCLPVGERPGSEMFAVAEEFGLDFTALTDHAEFSLYNRNDLQLDLEIWEETLRLAAEAEGGPVIPIVGFEWTGVYNEYDPDIGGVVAAGGHRTVVFDDLEPCEEYWVGASNPESRKDAVGIERYIYRGAIQGGPDAMWAHMARADESCDQVRHLSWFHHSGLNRPRAVNWSLEMHQQLGDPVVEIYSEHGSSECHDLGMDGCAWSVDDSIFEASGSVQSALQQGYALGFVAGTDSHDGRPGSLGDGPGVIVGDVGGSTGGYHLQFAPGGVTGALVAGAEPGRKDIIDAVELRNTVAASWLFDAVRIAAVGQDGLVYLPGDDVPAEASPVRLVVEIEDAAVETWLIEVLDPWGQVWLSSEVSSLEEPLDLAAGEARYVRVRATMQDQEHRLWASPFFGVE